MVCAFHHYKSVNSRKSAIRIVRLTPEQERNIPTFCVQCDNAPCEMSCPTKAIIRKGPYLKINSDLCINCNNPFDYSLIYDDFQFQ